jgi:hypothetical protein
MDALDLAALAAHTLAALCIGIIPLAAYRWIRERSHIMAAIVAATILVRAAVGVALFWISYLNLPVAESLQAGGGFWQLAVDARQYYAFAADAIDRGALGLDALAPSPFFVWVLTLWMTIVGVSPAAGMYLNLCLYVGLMALVVWRWKPANDWHRDLPCIAFVAAYSIFPVILIHSTQPLKDELFNVLLAAVCLGVLAATRLVYGPPDWRRHGSTVAGGVAIAVATFGAAGIRWYFGFMIWCALALLLAICAVAWRRMPFVRYVAGSVALLAVVWLGFWAGAGRYYWIAVGLTGPAQLTTMTQLARLGFLTSGGNTSTAVPLRSDSGAGQQRYQELLDSHRGFEGAEERFAAEAEYLRQGALARGERALAPPTGPPADAKSGADDSPKAVVDPAWAPATRAMPITIGEQLVTVARGVAVIFVPIALLERVSSVDIDGGRGLLSIVDLDTLVLDITSLGVLILLWRRRHTIGDRLPFVAFGLILAAVSAVLLGYVVTNFGTLWRLRSFIAVPLWLLVLAVAPRSSPKGGAPDGPSNAYESHPAPVAAGVDARRSRSGSRR